MAAAAATVVGAPAYLLKHRIWSALTNYTGFSTSLAEASNCMPVAIDVDSPHGNAAAAPLRSPRIRVSGARPFGHLVTRTLCLLFGLFSPALLRPRGHFARLRGIVNVPTALLFPIIIYHVYVYSHVVRYGVSFSQPRPVRKGSFLSFFQR